MSGVAQAVARRVIVTPTHIAKPAIKPPKPDAVANALRKLLPKELPASLEAPRPGNLYQVLSRHPDGGVGRRVTQCRWGPKGIESSFWVVTRAKFKDEGKHGKAWGKLIWKGKNVTKGKDERIRGALKYTWVEGVSTSPQKSSETPVPSSRSSP